MTSDVPESTRPGLVGTSSVSEFTLKPRNVPRRAAFQASIAALATGVLLYFSKSDGSDVLIWILSSYGLAALLMSVLAKLKTPRKADAVRVAEGAISWPSLLGLGHGRVIPTSEITGLEIVSRRGWGYLRLGRRNRWPLMLASAHLEVPEDFGRFCQAVEAAVPVATARDVITSERVLLWLSIVAAMAIPFVVASHALLEQRDAVLLLEWGGLSRVLIQEGEWFRLVTVAFVHVNVMHLLVNALLILIAVPLLEPRLGASKLGILLIYSGIGSALFSTWFSEATVVVGMSGAIYGVLGHLAYRWFTSPSDVPVRFRSIPGWFLAGLILSDLVLAAVYPGVAFSMHFGGLVTGVMISMVLHLRGSRRLQNVGGVCSLGIVVVCTGFLLLRIAEGNYQAKIANTLVTSGHSELSDINMGAWWLATADALDESGIRVARSRLAEVAGDVMEPLDTLATLDFRLADFDSAIEIERHVLAERPRRVFASQLARFERAAELDTRDAGEITERDGDLCVRGPSDTQFEIHAIQLQRDEIISFIRARGVTDGTCFRRPGAVRPGWEISTTLVEASDDDRLDVSAWRMDERVLALP